MIIAIIEAVVTPIAIFALPAFPLVTLIEIFTIRVCLPLVPWRTIIHASIVDNILSTIVNIPLISITWLIAALIPVSEGTSFSLGIFILPILSLFLWLIAAGYTWNWLNKGVFKQYASEKQIQDVTWFTAVTAHITTFVIVGLALMKYNGLI